ncbi:hypothetical protein COCVIDRAFT_25906 [Bipolaris victoriae FI3]|uniref:Uncharacterized protein n=1 Tax=Bipolaris victoriae (strain FI3) TaxID=930091 RepID=W7EV74_BIPV3|nr:hypothetical protein COCVIDRAFT_25906 [Bipolaris victoriae FI3]
MGTPLKSACTDLQHSAGSWTVRQMQVDVHGAAHARNSPVLMMYDDSDRNYRGFVNYLGLALIPFQSFSATPPSSRVHGSASVRAPSTGDTASVKHNNISDRCGAFLRRFFISLLLERLTAWGPRGFLASTTPEMHVHDSAQPGNRPSLHTSEVVEQAEAPVAIKALEHVQGPDAPSRL